MGGNVGGPDELLGDACDAPGGTRSVREGSWILRTWCQRVLGCAVRDRSWVLRGGWCGTAWRKDGRDLSIEMNWDFFGEFLSELALASLEEDQSWLESGDGRVGILFYFDWYDVIIFLIM